MWYDKKYESVGSRIRKAEKKLKALKKKNPTISPIIAEERKITRTWWGNSWVQNLDSYSDYSNRLGRGRSYIRNGFVLDLKIKKGSIHSLVMGTRSTPYSIKIEIEPLSPSKWSKIKKLSRKHIDSLPELLEGKFPKDLEVIFSNRKDGLFPTPREISLDCSCPDWAEMCKHVSAALCAVGVKLDQDPELIFKLRGVKASELISKAIKDEAMSLKTNTKNKKHLLKKNEKELGKLFKINLTTKKK